MTVKELKELLQDKIDMLDYQYEDEQEVRISCNTYRMGSNFLSTREGFIDFNNPVEEEEED